MNLLNKLTLKNLKLNKKRTIVTIIGIILSTALLAAVFSMFFSARGSFINFEVRRKGNYHYYFSDVPTSALKTISLNRKLDKIYLVKNIGYSLLTDFSASYKNPYKPYFYVKAFAEDSLKNLGVHLVEGRMPENSSEILISSHLNTNAGIKLAIGSKISLHMGNRIFDGENLTQNNPYIEGEEFLSSGVEKSYTVVGFMERLSMEDYSSPGYVAVTYLDEKDSTENVDVYVRYTKDALKDHLKITAGILGVDEEAFSIVHNVNIFSSLSEEKQQEYLDKISDKKYSYDVNSYLVAMETGIIGDSTLQALGVAVLIVVAIIIFTSVFCIKNSFDISITEKIRQYGMLSSIGATKKQIKKNVYYEAFILGIIGIPLGILSGIFASYILIIISNYFLSDLFGFDLVFVFSLGSILFAILLGYLTIFLSARKSARKASLVSPISAIRSSNDIKMPAKKMKTPFYIKKLFGIGGDISYKNLKRSKKKYRTTIVSVVICVAIFLALSSFVELAFSTIKVNYQSSDYNLSFSYHNKEEDFQEKIRKIPSWEGIKRISNIFYSSLEFKSDRYSKEYMEIHPEIGKETDTDLEDMDYLRIAIVDFKEFERYAKSLGLSYEQVKTKGILINTIFDYKSSTGGSVQVEIPKFSYQAGDTIKGKVPLYDEKRIDFEIEICKVTEKVPFGISNYNYDAVLVLSEAYKELITDSTVSNVYIDSSQPNKTFEQLEELFKEENIFINNIAESFQMMNSFYTLIAIFLYGFITVIALIGVTNIFNTITTNMNLRRREFAMLKSIGMTKKEFYRMIRLESFFYGIKSLLIGIPIGCVLSYLIYKALSSGSVIIRYHLPIIAIFISILAVFVLIFVIMRYSIRKINHQNTIETIRNENI